MNRYFAKKCAASRDITLARDDTIVVCISATAAILMMLVSLWLSQ